MEYALKNKNSSAKFGSLGGEITELIVNGTNYIWNADPKFWNYHAPTLFPIVCRLKDGKYTYEGKTYELPSHGFTRISEHDICYQDESKITFNLKYSDETLKAYPFKFDLKTEYTLGEDSLTVDYIVENVDDKDMYFSIGGHTAFMCPFAGGDNKDYYLEFNEKETADTFLCDEKGLIKKETAPFLNNENIISLENKDPFIDTIMFENLKSSKVMLKSKNTDNYIEFDFKGFPYIAFWSIAADAPFVCIEPWYGMPDEVNFDGDLNEKLGIVKIKSGERFKCRQGVRIV